MVRVPRLSAIACILLGAILPAPFVHGQAPAAPSFDRDVVPILAEHCLSCHGGTRPKGRLDLTRAKTTLQGGKSGPALKPGKAAASLLWQRVDAGEMPPRTPLSARDKAILKNWIEAGAIWTTDPIDPFRITTNKRAGYDWWSLQPLRKPSPPAKAEWGRNAIDAFVLAKLQARIDPF